MKQKKIEAERSAYFNKLTGIFTLSQTSAPSGGKFESTDKKLAIITNRKLSARRKRIRRKGLNENIIVTRSIENSASTTEIYQKVERFLFNFFSREEKRDIALEPWTGSCEELRGTIGRGRRLRRKRRGTAAPPPNG